MADSMCGPSNPLQSFQKHNTIDRTLQQDRLTARQSPSQGFRSSPSGNAQLVNQEFESFQNGQFPFENSSNRQYFPSPPPQTLSAPPNYQQAGPSNWASDFQRLNISAPLRPQSQQTSFTPVSQQRHDTGGWHQDFAQQQNQNEVTGAGRPLQQMSTTFGYVPDSLQYMGQHNGTLLGRGYTGQQADMSMSGMQHNVEVFDEEAFARAFDKAQEDIQSHMPHPDEQQATNMDQDVMNVDETGGILTRDIGLSADENRLVQQAPIGADTIQEPTSDALDPYDSPDTLAKTAGDLLQSLRHDQSSKFQNSQFLELMRQFRDREATIDKDTNAVVTTESEINNLMMSGGNQVGKESGEDGEIEGNGKVPSMSSPIQDSPAQMFDTENNGF